MSAVVDKLREKLGTTTGKVLLSLFSGSVLARASRSGRLRERGVSGGG